MDEMPLAVNGNIGFNPKEIFESNIVSIKASDIMVVITDGKDVGTIFEAGVAFREGMPICYLWVDHDGSNCLLMLAQSGSAGCLA